MQPYYRTSAAARPVVGPRPRGPALLLLGLGCSAADGLRVEGPGRPPQVEEGLQVPPGPPVEPVGRHLQYLWVDHPHGMTDRLAFYIRPLVKIGRYHNATVHIRGGANGPKLWLHWMHTVGFADSWGRYFDLRANSGNPFHELVNFQGCKSVHAQSMSGEQWAHVFDGNTKCVNIVDLFPKTVKNIPIVAAHDNDVPLSPLMLRDADRFLRKYEVPKEYASIHIRRCDRFRGNQYCTDPEAIFQAVRRSPEHSTWLVFAYAEEGYIAKLRRRLAPLGRRFLFEDEVELNTRFPQDNYYSYLLGKYLNGGSALMVETHQCRDRTPAIFTTKPESHGIYLSRSSEDSEPQRGDGSGDSFEREEAYLAAEEEYEALCDAKERGAHLLNSKWP